MKREKLQKVLVDSANNEINNILQKYCKDKFHSNQYYLYIKENLENKVIEIPNPQIWVEDSYLTNSTTLSMMNIAREPFTYCLQPCNYDIPIDEPNFGENRMAEITDSVFYERYLADCIHIFKELESYYPTHTVEVHDFSYMLYTFWCKTNIVLLQRTKEHYKQFFTRTILNQFLTALTYPKSEIAPNIKFIMYDAVGLMSQCAEIKYNMFKTRFRPGYSLLSAFTQKDYNKFIEDVIAPLRSMKALKADCNYWNIEFREVNKFNNEVYHNLQGLMEGQRGSMHKALYTAFTELINGTALEDILEILKNTVESSTYNSICNNLTKNKDVEFNYKYEFNSKAVERMQKRGITFVNYEYKFNLFPPAKVLSEVIINMDEFRKQYPSCTEQQFSEVYLMAQAINSAKRTFAKNYKRDNWNLCVKIVSGSKPFEFTKLIENLTTKLKSEEMDNFIVRVV